MKPTYSYLGNDSPGAGTLHASFRATKKYNGKIGEHGVKVPENAKVFETRNIAPFKIDVAAKEIEAKGFKTAIFPGPFYRGYGRAYRLVAWKEPTHEGSAGSKGR